MIIDPGLLLKIMPHIAKVVEKITGKKTGLPELLKILPEIDKLTKAFKDPNIDETPETPTDPDPTPDPTPGTDPGLTIGGGRHTSGIGNLLQIDPDILNWGKPPIANSLFSSRW